MGRTQHGGVRKAGAVAFLLMTAGVAAGGCSNPVVEAVTGVDFVQTYSQEQKAAYRAAVLLGANSLSGGAFDEPTPSEWDEMYTYAEATCAGIEENGVDWVREKISTQVIASEPNTDPAFAGVFADLFINAATAQGSFCPGVAG